MNLKLAFKLFFRALKDSAWAQKAWDNKLCKDHTKDAATHLELLSLLQKSGRLVDFFQEDISGCTDEQVGAAARHVHAECRQVLEQWVTIRPVLEEAEGVQVQIPEGYDVSSIKVVGKVKGAPPYKGVVVHGGWRAHKRSLPKRAGEHDAELLFPAEVELR